MFTVPIVIILLGCIISGMGFLGCWGAIRENYKVLMTVKFFYTGYRKEYNVCIHVALVFYHFDIHMFG